MNQAKHRFTILLIESDDDIASIIARATASVFPEALIERIKATDELISYTETIGSPPKLILATDYRLASGDGSMSLRRLIEAPFVHCRPVLLLDYSSRESAVENYYQQGITAVHTKPETYPGWKLLVAHIRNFWFLHARIPQ